MDNHFQREKTGKPASLRSQRKSRSGIEQIACWEQLSLPTDKLAMTSKSRERARKGKKSAF